MGKPHSAFLNKDFVVRKRSRLYSRLQGYPITYVSKALKARNSKAQGEGAQRRNPWVSADKANSPVRAAQSVSPLQGYYTFFLSQGCGCFAALPWALLLRAFSAYIPNSVIA
jgi:hypothetical protein